MLSFAKLQGAGNGYVVVDGRGRDLDWPRLARRICEPRFGVGSDGLAEAAQEGLAVETGGGIRLVRPLWQGSSVVAARVAMGAPCFDPARIPLETRLLGAASLEAAPCDFSLEIGGMRISLSCLAIGNPHAVAILEEDVAGFPLAEIGPLVTNHPLFPNRVNFEIVNVLGRDLVRVRVFERGEGETLASGTGGTASVIAARRQGLVDDVVRVRLRGGELRVGLDDEGEAWLEGPAVEVFTGDWRGAD